MMMMMSMVTETEHSIGLDKVEKVRRSADPRWCHESEGCE
jgi:hypothetical protein